MFTTATAKNYRANVELDISYAAEELSNGVMKFVRTARKSYEFFGLDYDSAMSIAATRRAMYMRKFTRVVELDNPLTDPPSTYYAVVDVWSQTTDVRVERDAGDIWKVVVEVDERDEKTGRPSDYEHIDDQYGMFGTANQRDYDDLFDGITLVIKRNYFTATGAFYVLLHADSPSVFLEVSTPAYLLYKEDEFQTEWSRVKLQNPNWNIFNEISYTVDGSLIKNGYIVAAEVKGVVSAPVEVVIPAKK